MNFYDLLLTDDAARMIEDAASTLENYGNDGTAADLRELAQKEPRSAIGVLEDAANVLENNGHNGAAEGLRDLALTASQSE
jgi:hypothetical protein